VRAIPLALTLGAVACAGQPSLPDACANTGPSAELGTGEDAYEPLEAGAEHTMVHGPQGGWHLLFAMQLTAMAPVVEAWLTVTDRPTGELASEAHFRVGTTTTGECTAVYTNMYAHLDVPRGSNAVETYGYHDFDLTLRVEDRLGREGADAYSILAVPDPRDLED
jgi:hypothetical protein